MLDQHHFDSVDPPDCTGCGMDSEPVLADDQQIGLYYGSGLLPLTLTGNVSGTTRSTISSSMVFPSIRALRAGYKTTAYLVRVTLRMTQSTASHARAPVGP